MAFTFEINDPDNLVSTDGKFEFKTAKESPYFRYALRRNRKFVKTLGAAPGDVSDVSTEDALDFSDSLFSLIEDVYREDEDALLAYDLVDEENLGEWLALFMGADVEALPKDHLS